MNSINKTFGWDIVTTPITANGIEIPNYKAITRSDNGACLNVAKATYTPTPNSLLVDTVERLSEITGFEKTGYSEFRGGRLILGYLKSNKTESIAGYPTDNYMVVGNSHDGSKSFFVGTSDIMLRCQNQFSHVSQQMKAYHTKNNALRIEEMLQAFQVYQDEKMRVNRNMEQFQKVKIDEKIIVALAERLFKMEAEEKLSTRKANLYEQFRGAVSRETGDLGMNLHGLFNSVTYYTTHLINTKETVFGNLVGLPADYNKLAYEFCAELAS